MEESCFHPHHSCAPSPLSLPLQTGIHFYQFLIYPVSFLIFFFFFFTASCHMQDLSSMTRDQTHTPCRKRSKSQLDHQTSPPVSFRMQVEVNFKMCIYYLFNPPFHTMTHGPCWSMLTNVSTSIQRDFFIHFIPGNCFTVWIYHNLLNQFPFDRHFKGFQTFTTANNATINYLAFSHVNICL